MNNVDYLAIKIINKRELYKIKVDNPTLPRIYGLPKIHKTGKAMRPITSSINAPTYNLAKWLVQKFNSFPKFESANLKNSLDLVDKIKDINIDKNDRLVSFDVTSLFPSIPIEKLQTLLKKWLNKIEMESTEAEDYILLTRLCIEQNFFSFNGKYYKQKSGLSMGNPLSPFLANLFMSAFETHMKMAFPWIFKVWHRYVDDIFAIVPNRHLDDALKLLNLQEKTIKFTIEKEDNGQLSFLDLNIIRNGTKLKFGIYRKPTQSENYIKNHSYNPITHKHAIINSLTHRLVNIPMDKAEYYKEQKTILHIAEENGYNKNLVFKKIKKAKLKKIIKEATTFNKETENNNTFSEFTYHPKTFNKFKKIFKEQNIILAPTNRYSVLKLLNSKTKDEIPPINRSGIYQINCKDCEKCYIGQTKRNLKTRVKEHFRNIKQKQEDKSAVAFHFWNKNHDIDPNPKLLKGVINKNKLTTWENILIWKNKDRVMNFEIPPVDNLIKKFIIPPPES